MYISSRNPAASCADLADLAAFAFLQGVTGFLPIAMLPSMELIHRCCIWLGWAFQSYLFPICIYVTHMKSRNPEASCAARAALASLQGVTGFLPAKDYATYYGADTSLLPGCLLDVAVTAAAGGSSSSSSGVVQVSVAHEAVSGGQLQQWEGLNMGSLLPGALLSCKVRQVSHVLLYLLQLTMKPCQFWIHMLPISYVC
jgi:hypothetical protein